MKIAIVAVTVFMAALPVSARPGGVAVVVTAAYQYLPGDSDPHATLEITRGDRLLLANVDPLGAHNLVSLDVADDAPLFSSDLVNMGEATEVDGVPNLAAGTYAFMCTVHGWDAMHGALEVR